ncbi:hypothetical protein XELAEV_18019731mg, partial [Xenopus laevis]
ICPAVCRSHCRTAKDAELLIDSLPREESTAALQVCIRVKPIVVQLPAPLARQVHFTYKLQYKIQTALADIAQSQLKTRSRAHTHPLTES